MRNAEKIPELYKTPFPHVIVKEGINQKLTSKEILEILFQKRIGLLESDKNHGVHQGSTHLGTVEGMMNWIRRENEKR